MTTLLRLTGDADADDRLVRQAAEALRSGQIVAFPTETVYGLGADIGNEAALRGVFRAKGRPANNPLIVHFADSAEVRQVAQEWPDAARQLAERFWPGPLTLVVPKLPAVSNIVTAGGPTVAVRLPAHPVARRLLQLANVPVAAPSANRSGQLSPTTAEHVRRGLGGLVDVIVDAGPTHVGLESTVLSLAERPPRLLRPGHITPAEIEAVIGPIEHRRFAEAGDAPLPSPGLLARHYAPRTPTVARESGAAELAAEWARQGQRVGLLTWRAMDEERPSDVIVRWLPSIAAGFAADMYAALHELDDLQLNRIVIDLPPDTAAWQAVRDRLRRAAAG